MKIYGFIRSTKTEWLVRQIICVPCQRRVRDIQLSISESFKAISREISLNVLNFYTHLFMFKIVLDVCMTLTQPALLLVLLHEIYIRLRFPNILVTIRCPFSLAVTNYICAPSRSRYQSQKQFSTAWADRILFARPIYVLTDTSRPQQKYGLVVFGIFESDFFKIHSRIST